MDSSIDLEAAKAAFFASGGAIVVLDGFSFRPLPPRKEPVKGKRRGVQSGKRQLLDVEKASQVAGLAKEMTCAEVSKALGIPMSTLWGMATRHNFKFAGVRGRHHSPYNDQAADAEMADKIIAAKALGMSRHAAQKELGISDCKFLRIIHAFNIDYPKTKSGPKGGQLS